MAKVLCAWSSGKDSAMALRRVLVQEEHEVVGLLTTLTRDYNRVSMHGVRRVLLEQQARSIGLPLTVVEIPVGASNEAYGEAMRAALEGWQQVGVSAVFFGDLFLEDVRRYREKQLAQVGMTAIFPLWGQDTRELARSLVAEGFKALVTCVDTQALAPEFAGCQLDVAFFDRLPASVDPCGENGEFHSFVYAGPIFKEPIAFSLGEQVLRDGRFQYQDIIPVEKLDRDRR